MRTDILKQKNKIIEWINNNEPKSLMYRELKCKPETLEFWLKKMGLEYNGNQGRKGIKLVNPSTLRKSALEYLASTKYISAHRLRLKLIEDNIKEHKCEECSLTEWNNKPIPLELHHKDGNRFNNKINNLQILCPNCHSQTENNSGKNKGNIKI